MNISLISVTPQAKELLILGKNTRHLSDPDAFNRILDMSDRKKNEEIDYVFSTISAPWEFVDYTFILHNVTRAFTHQLVRHRVGTAFSQQSLRVAHQSAFSYFVPESIEQDQYVLALYDTTMGAIQEGYNLMAGKGGNTQDIRGVLPTNICTNILFKINLRAFALLMETRLCIRAQGEFQQAALIMRDLVLEAHPWIPFGILAPHCVAKNRCQFSRFDCPMKAIHPHLRPIDNKIRVNVARDHNKMTEKAYSPQPEQQGG